MTSVGRTGSRGSKGALSQKIKEPRQGQGRDGRWHSPASLPLVSWRARWGLQHPARPG